MELVGATLIALAVTAAAFAAYKHPGEYPQLVKWFVFALVVWGVFAMGWNAAIGQTVSVMAKQTDVHEALQPLAIPLLWTIVAPTLAAIYVLVLVGLPFLGFVERKTPAAK